MAFGPVGWVGGKIKDAGKAVGGKIKDAGKWTWNAVDDFDDAIHLKEIANILSYVPGPHQPAAKGLSMLYAGVDTGKAIKDKDPLRAMMSGTALYYAGKNPTKGGWSPEGYGKEDILPGLLKGAKAAAKPAALMALSSMSQRPQYSPTSTGSNFFLRPTIGQQQGGRQNPFRAIRNPYTAKQRLPQFASGGMAGIPRLPDNFEGYVDKPHIVSLGERGTEVVVPLWKLMQQTRRS